jgi:hypothetical protein
MLTVLVWVVMAYMRDPDEKRPGNLETELLMALVSGIPFEFNVAKWMARDNSVSDDFVSKAIIPLLSRGMVAFDNPSETRGKIHLTQAGRNLFNSECNRHSGALSWIAHNVSPSDICGRSGMSSNETKSAGE